MRTKKEIQAIIDAVIVLRDSATDDQAAQASILYPEWTEEMEYVIGQRVRKDGEVIVITEEKIAEWAAEKLAKSQDSEE